MGRGMPRKINGEEEDEKKEVWREEKRRLERGRRI